MFGIIKKKLNQRKRCKEWRARNWNNDTFPANDFNFDYVTVGNGTYGDIRVLTFNKGKRLEIGHFCSIASGVVFVVSADHCLNCVSTYPFKVKSLKTQTYEAASKGNIVVGSDVWIGQNSVVLSGVTIGQGAVIGAGAIVTKDVPPYAIAAGNPAKVIKYRFDKEKVNYLNELDYSRLTRELIQSHIEEMYVELDGLDIEEIKRLLGWFPKKSHDDKMGELMV